MSLFRVDASIMPATSASRELGDLVEREWVQAHPGSPVIRRDIAADPIPSTAWTDAVSAGFTPSERHTETQRAALALRTQLADELVEAEAVLLTVPLYNYGVSQHAKLWFDLAYTDPRIDPQGGALRGKPATLVTVLGGNYDAGSPKEGWDHSTGWLRRVLGDVWGLDLTVVTRPFTLVGVNPALDAFSDAAAELKSRAEDAARGAGRALAGARG